MRVLELVWEMGAVPNWLLPTCDFMQALWNATWHHFDWGGFVHPSYMQSNALWNTYMAPSPVEKLVFAPHACSLIVCNPG